MRIEDLDQTKVAKATDKQLLILRLRFIQLWDKNFKISKTAVVGSLCRDAFLRKYRLVLNQLNDRNLSDSTEDIDRAAFKKAMEIKKLGIDVSALADHALVAPYVSIDGSFIDNHQATEVIQLTIHDSKNNADAQLEKSLSNAIKDAVGKDTKFKYCKTGPTTNHIPLFSKVLCAQSETKIVQVTKRKLILSAYHKALDEWTDYRKLEYPQLVKQLTGHTVLSLGCGTGCIEQKLVEDGFEVYCIDNDKEALRICKAKGLPIEKLDLNHEAVPYDENEFDNVIGISVLHCLDKPTELIKQARTIASRKVVFVTPLNEPLSDHVKWEFSSTTDFLDKVTKELNLSEKKIKARHVSKSGDAVIVIIKAAPGKEDLTNVVDDDDDEEQSAEILKAKAEQDNKLFERSLKLCPVIQKATKKEERIVYGIVYEPNVVDAQGDKATEEEIRKAAYCFMEKAQVFKVNHKGNKVSVRILENFIAPSDFTVAKQVVKKGSWILVTRVVNNKIWKAIKAGKLTGYSLSGYANAVKAD